MDAEAELNYVKYDNQQYEEVHNKNGEEAQQSMEAPRRVYINDPTANLASNFRPNVVVTSKYKWWNFIFKNLFEQVLRNTSPLKINLTSSH